MWNYFCPRRPSAGQSNSRGSEPSINDPEMQPLSNEGRQERAPSPLEQWRASAKRLDNFETLLAHETDLQVVVNEMASYKQEQIDRYSFLNLLKCYRGWLQRKLSSQQSDSVARYLQEQLSTTLFELSLATMTDGMFSYAEIARLRGFSGRELTRYIAEKVASAEEKKAMLLSVAERVYNEVEGFLMEYLQFSLDPNEAVFQIFLLSESEEQSLRARGMKLDSFSIVCKAIQALAVYYQNYELATRLTVLLRSKYPKRSDELRQTEFTLRICSYFLYESNRYSMDYAKVQAMSQQQIMHELLSCEPTHSLEALRPIFEVLDEGSLDRCYQSYVFSQMCQLDISLQLLEEQRVPTSEDTVLQLLEKVRRGHFEYSRYIKKLQYVFEPYRNIESVNRMFEVLEVANVFYFFGINEKLAVIDSLLEMDERNARALQEDSLRLLRDLLTQYCMEAYPDKHATINGVIYDFDRPETLLSLALYLKTHLFGRLLSETLVHQMIFQHLLHYNRLRELEQLLTPKNLDDNGIDYGMVEMVVAQHISELLDQSNSWADIRDIVEYLSSLLQTKTVQRRNIRNTLKLSSYLDGQGCLPGKTKLPRPLNITFLYSLLNVNAQLNFEKVYKYILKIKATNLQPVDINTKEFMRFQGQLAQRIYRKGHYQQGCELLNKLALLRPTWLAEVVIRILKELPNLPAKHREPLLVLAYEHSVHPDQLQLLFGTNNQLTQPSLQRDLLNYCKEYIGNAPTYAIGDPNFILKEEEYKNLVAEAKFTESVLKEQPYELFFVLLASDYRRAFYYVYKQGLELQKIEFFLKESLRIELIEPYLSIPAMLKMLLAVAHKRVDNYETPFKEFKTDLSVSDLAEIDKKHGVFQNNREVDETLKSLLKKYYINTRICLTCTEKTLIKCLGSRSELTKFLEDRTYRKTFLINALNQPSSSDLRILEKIALLEDIHFKQLAIDTICNSLNTEVVPKSLLHVMENVSRLLAGSQPLTKEFLSRVCGKVYNSRMLFLFLRQLRNLEQGSSFQEVILQNNLQILNSVSRLEKNNEFFGLFPSDFVLTELKPRLIPNARLSNQHRQILQRALSLENAFVLSKLMYFVYGFDERIERETLELVKHQSPQLAAGLEQLQARTSRN